MDKDEISILLEILDLEYLKPILTDRFKYIHELKSVNLSEIGIKNHDHLYKLKYVLDKYQQDKRSIEQYNPVLSLYDANHMVMRIENEINLISSCLNLLLDSNYDNIPQDDATSDIDYILYNSKLEQVQTDIQQLERNIEKLIAPIQTQSIQSEQASYTYRNHSYTFYARTLIILTLSVCSISLMFYMKRK